MKSPGIAGAGVGFLIDPSVVGDNTCVGEDVELAGVGISVGDGVAGDDVSSGTARRKITRFIQ